MLIGWYAFLRILTILIENSECGVPEYGEIIKFLSLDFVFTC